MRHKRPPWGRKSRRLQAAVAVLVLLAGAARTERIAGRLGPGVSAAGRGRALRSGVPAVTVSVSASHGLGEHRVLTALAHMLWLARLRHVLRPLDSELHMREHAGHGIAKLRQHLLEELETLALV